MIRVPAEVRRSFGLDVRADDAFALLRDVPRWGRLFPHVADISALPEYGPDAWRWTMEPLGPPGMEARTVYACRYTFDEAARSVVWTPIPEVGNATFEGAVALTAQGHRTAGELELAATLEIPAPGFLRGVVRAALALEFGRMTDRFLVRLAEEVRAM